MIKWWVGLIIVVSGNMVNYAQHGQTPKEIDISFVVDYVTDDMNGTTHCDQKCDVGTWLWQIVQHLFEWKDIDTRVGVIVRGQKGFRHLISMANGKPATDLAQVLDELNSIKLVYMANRVTNASFWLNIVRKMTTASEGNRPSAPDVLVWICEYRHLVTLNDLIDLANGPHVMIGRVTYESHDRYSTAVSIVDPDLYIHLTTTKEIADIILLKNCTGPRCPAIITTTTGTVTEPIGSSTTGTTTGSTGSSTTEPTGSTTTKPTQSTMTEPTWSTTTEPTGTVTGPTGSTTMEPTGSTTRKPNQSTMAEPTRSTTMEPTTMTVTMSTTTVTTNATRRTKPTSGMSVGTTAEKPSSPSVSETAGNLTGSGTNDTDSETEMINQGTSTVAVPLLEPLEIAMIALTAVVLLTVGVGLLVCYLHQRRRNGPKEDELKHSSCSLSHDTTTSGGSHSQVPPMSRGRDKSNSGSPAGHLPHNHING